MNANLFGVVCRRYREECGLSRRALAQQLHIATAEVRWWEESGIRPEAPLLQRLARALGLHEEELLLACGELPPRFQRYAQQAPREVWLALQKVLPPQILPLKKLPPKILPSSQGCALMTYPGLSALKRLPPRRTPPPHLWGTPSPLRYAIPPG